MWPAGIVAPCDSHENFVCPKGTPAALSFTIASFPVLERTFVRSFPPARAAVKTRLEGVGIGKEGHSWTLPGSA